MSDIGKGDKVSWSSHGQQVHGKVTKKISERTEDSGRTVDADEDHPQYRVRSDKTGKEAVHKPGALKREN
jgi:hypothetical protein